MKQIILIFLLLNSVLANSQTYSLNATIKGDPLEKIYLTNYYGGQNTLLDSANIDSSGVFKFKLKENYKKGLYKIILSKGIFINIICNNENIEFTTYFSAPVDSMKIISSDENKIYYDFLQRDNNINTKLEILSQLPLYFPKTDEFYIDIEKQYNKIQKQHQSYISMLIKDKNKMLATSIIKSMNYPMLEFDLPEESKKAYIKQHFLDNVDFNDTLLLYSDVFTNKAFAYIQLFNQQGVKREQQEQEYIKAIDILMLKSEVNIRIKNQIRDYIIRGFEMLDMDNVLSYIVENYSMNTKCEDERYELRLKKRIEGNKKLAIGNKAPDVIFKNNNNGVFNLAEIKKKYTLILFWASWCPHCMANLPEIKRIYDQQNENLEVVAISIDTDKIEYNTALQNGDYNWINYCDFKGWDGKTAIDYYLYATPTMFLLDKNKMIIAKPLTVKELNPFF